jgi:hypothetical protein
MAMVEPFISHRVDGRVRIDLGAEATIRAMTVAAGIGNTSAYTWLKVPVVEEMERVMAATTLPALLLGGEVSRAQDAAFESWRKALKLPTVQGLVIGRSLLYPPDDDVAAAHRVDLDHLLVDDREPDPVDVLVHQDEVAHQKRRLHRARRDLEGLDPERTDQEHDHDHRHDSPRRSRLHWRHRNLASGAAVCLSIAIFTKPKRSSNHG